MALTQFLLHQWFHNQEEDVLINPTFLYVLLSLLFISTTFVLLRSILVNPSSSLNLPPCPPKLPIIGNLHQLGSLPHRSFRDLSRKHGPLMLLSLGQAKVLVVSSAEMAREIIKNQDLSFAERPFSTPGKALAYGCKGIIFSPYTEYWRQAKKLCVLDLLSLKRVQSFKFFREAELSISLVEKISQSASAGSVVNLTEMLGILSNNIIARCAFGSKYVGEDGKNKFGELSKRVIRLLGAFCVGDYFPSLGWMDNLTGMTGSLKRTWQEIDAFLDWVIDDRLMMKSEVHGDSDQHFLIDRLILAQKDEALDVKLKREDLKAIMMDMFISGTDSAAMITEWAMAELIRSPKEMMKAQEEVRRVVGKKMKLVVEEDIQHMDYLKCIIKETLRLHGTILPREAITNANVNGYHIPAKARVLINAWAIQREPKVWDRAEEFVPERFMSTNIDFKGHDFEFLPFGSGRRSCPGMSFGLATIELATANLLYWFDWELPDGETREQLDMSETFGVDIHKKVPLLLVPTRHSFN